MLVVQTGTTCKSATVGLKIRFLFLILSLTKDPAVSQVPRFAQRLQATDRYLKVKKQC